jgi:hypothetical protein
MKNIELIYREEKLTKSGKKYLVVWILNESKDPVKLVFMNPTLFYE